jgi:hypothetical protein
VRSDSFRARTSSSCSTQYVLSVKVEHPGNAQPCSIGINNSLTVLGTDCEASLGRMAGTRPRVLRIFAAVTLVVLLTAGCGAARRHEPTRQGVPRVLAQRWAASASAIGDAAAAGNSCRALNLAKSLRDEVIAQQGRLPRRLRLPLLTGVNALADRLTCTQTVTTQTTPAKKLPKPPPKPPHERHGHHGHHGHGGDNGDQG